MSQLHKKFSDEQVRHLFQRYLSQELERKYLQQILGISKARFFDLLKLYRSDPAAFSLQYQRRTPSRLSAAAEQAIIEQLTIEKNMIEQADIPIHRYNYSFIRDCPLADQQLKISLPTIIQRAKHHGFYLPKKPRRRIHDREVLTDYAGELIQHDSSHHLFSPAAKEKWYLITSLDDYSRFILYAALVRKETSWTHIEALQRVMLQHGMPLAYYVDSHSIFRFVQGRDSLWRTNRTLTDETTPQWKQVLNDCHVTVIHALSPQAKGKIERPYQWLQDHLVRLCVREEVTDIRHGLTILRREINRYNYKQVHSTTEEIPFVRFQRALKEGKSLFRDFSIPAPFQSPKDIFCLRTTRMTNAYRKLSLNGIELLVKKAPPRETIELRIYPLSTTAAEVRCWYGNELIDIHKVTINAFEAVHF